jgi:N-acetylneuraminic acid mutarotase
MKKSILVTALMLGSILSADSAEGNWTKKTGMPTARAALSAQVVNGKIYAIGGLLSDTLTMTGTTEAYDPSTDTWTTRTAMPTPRGVAASAVLNGKIYVFGGDTDGHRSISSAVTEEYDPSADTWTTKAAMPTRRMASAAFVLADKIHVVSGWRGALGDSDFVDVIEVYDPATDTWEYHGNAIINARGNFGLSQVNGKIYQFGGTRFGVTGGAETTEYDPASNLWSSKARMLSQRHFLPAVALDGKVYLTGGNSRPEPAGATLQIYDPQTDVWSHGLDMPTARSAHAAVAVDGKMYALGGLSGDYWSKNYGGQPRGTVYATVEAYTPVGYLNPFTIEKVQPMTYDGRKVLQVTFQSAPGDGYTLETSVNLQDWSEVTTALVAANGDAATYQFEPVDPMADVLFIRVRRE